MLALLLSSLLVTGTPAGPDPLTSWDAARADALLAGDAAALRALYVDGSAAGRADLALLRAYQRRGARLTALRTQVFSRRTTSASRDERTEVVVERVLSSVSLPERCRVLPASAPRRRELVLRRVDGQWRMASVTTAATSRSANS